MSDAMKALLNLRSLRALAKEMSTEQLHEALEKLQTVVEERKEIDRQEEEKRKRDQRETREVPSNARCRWHWSRRAHATNGRYNKSKRTK